MQKRLYDYHRVNEPGDLINYAKVTQIQSFLKVLPMMSLCQLSLHVTIFIHSEDRGAESVNSYS